MLSSAAVWAKLERDGVARRISGSGNAMAFQTTRQLHGELPRDISRLGRFHFGMGIMGLLVEGKLRRTRPAAGGFCPQFAFRGAGRKMVGAQMKLAPGMIAPISAIGSKRNIAGEMPVLKRSTLTPPWLTRSAAVPDISVTLRRPTVFRAISHSRQIKPATTIPRAILRIT